MKSAVHPAAPRVLHVVLSLTPGGTERLVVALVRKLHPQVPSAVCCLDEPGLWGVELGQTGMVVTSLHRQPGFRLSLSRGVVAAARAHQATVIHAHQFTPYVYAALGRVLWRGPRVVFTEHGRLSDAPPSRKRRLVNRVLGHVPARIISVSDELKRYMALEGLPARRIEVVPNGIELDHGPSHRREVREWLQVADHQFLVVTVARLDPVKSLGTMIHAMRLLPANVVAVIIGDGPERQSLEQLALHEGVSRRIRFLGHREDARRILHGCDAYVNCSSSEGISLTILEAMAAGLPVVATNVGGTPEIVDSSTGILIHPGASDELAAAIERLLDRGPLAIQLGQAAAARVKSKFLIDQMIETYRTIYYEIGASAPAPHSV